MYRRLHSKTAPGHKAHELVKYDIMGTQLGRLVYPDNVNPKTGLSTRDVNRVRKSWQKIYENRQRAGAEVFKRYFRMYPEAKSKFIYFKDLPEAELSKCSQFNAHVLNVMSSFNVVFEKLNQPEEAIALLEQLGDRHSRKKISPRLFEQLRVVFLEILVEALKLDEDYTQSWEKTMGFISKQIYPRLTTV